jgi:four helix bundle protein
MIDMLSRTRAFAIDIIKFCTQLPRKQEYWIISKQLMRSGTSVGANYRASQKAKSRADFIAKLAIVEEEADESLYWLELLEALWESPDPELFRLKDEARQLLAIVISSKKTAKAKLIQEKQSKTLQKPGIKA